MDEKDDPGADTAMFRAFVGNDKPQAGVSTPATNRSTWVFVAIAVALVILVLVALLAL
jgi:hypothetical protein